MATPRAADTPQCNNSIVSSELVHFDRSPAITIILETPNLFPPCYKSVLEATFGDVRFMELGEAEGHFSGVPPSGKRVIVLDGLRNLDCLTRLQSFEQLYPKVILVVAVDGAPDPELFDRFMSESFTCSLLAMDVRLDFWLSSIRMILDGHEFIPSRYIRNYMEQKTGYGFDPDIEVTPLPDRHDMPSDDLDIRHLTKREHEVLVQISKGIPNKLIANYLKLSEHTVKLHVHRVIKKLGVTNRTEAASIYHRALAAR